VTQVGVVVVRYFGGTLLGVPGLIQAYKTSASLALQTVPRMQRPVLANYRVEFEYTQLNDVMRLLKQCHCELYRQDLQLFSYIEFGVPKNREQELLYRLDDNRNLVLTASE
jgi:putative IMPACT (imprinted ancient) family translation regulator